MIQRDDAKLALLLCSIEPRLSGFIVVGGCGVGKSTLLSTLKKITDEKIVRIPIGVGEERLVGGVDFESAVRGEKKESKTLLNDAKDGFLLIEGMAKMTDFTAGYIFSKKDSGAKFRIAASWHPDDGEISPHFIDRIDLCAVIEPITDEKIRTKIAISNIKNTDDGRTALDRQSVEKAKKTLDSVVMSDEALNRAIELAVEANSDGHRGELALVLAARAYAALSGDEKVSAHHVEKVAPLALVHRQKEQQPPPPPEDNNDDENDSDENQNNDGQNNEQNNSDEGNNNNDRDSNDSDGDSDGNMQREGVGREETIKADAPMSIKKLSFLKDKINRNSLGYRTATKTDTKRGRTIRTVNVVGKDISVPSTLRTAAPWQKSRGRLDGQKIIIDDADIQNRKREAKTAHTMIMVLDISGSMGVQARIKEAKSACLGLLKDAYTKREEVAVVAFRGESAECVVSPTRAGATVSERLNALPTGGKTPLASGLKETYMLIQKIRQKDATRRITCIIMTDAKANSGADDGEKPWESAKKWANTLGAIWNIDWIVIDTEGAGFVKLGRAGDIANILRARYLDFGALKDETLHSLVRGVI